jgi:hypothetical protein
MRARNTFYEFVLYLNCERYFTHLLNSGMTGAEFPVLPPKAIWSSVRLRSRDSMYILVQTHILLLTK